MGKKRTTYSWSRLEHYAICGESYRRRYIEKDYRPAGPAAVVGTAVHESIDQNMRYKQVHGDTLDVDTCIDIAHQKAAGEIKAERMHLSKEQKGEYAQIVETVLNDARRLAALHCKELAPLINPQRIEHHWIISIKGVPWRVQGYIDLQEWPLPNRKAGRIRDTKTKAATPPKGSVDKSDQLTIYSLWSYINDGEIPEVSMDSLVKTKKEKIDVQTGTRTIEQLNCAKNRMIAAVKGVEAGLFLPASRDHWKCSDKYCPYYRECKYTKGWR